MMIAGDNSTLSQVLQNADDVKVATLAWGFTLGFGVLTALKIVEQTVSISRRVGFSKSVYLWMVWILYIDNCIGSVIIWMKVYGNIKRRSAQTFSGPVTHHHR
jgi:hypothetical protein